jgi:hypothetical protein
VEADGVNRAFETIDVLKGNIHFATFGVTVGTWLASVPGFQTIDAADISVVAAAVVTIIAAKSKAKRDNSEANLNDAKAEIIRQALGDPDRVLHALQNQCIDEHCPYRRD